MAAFAGVALVAAALATAVGLRISVTTKNVAEAAEPLGVATSPALPRCQAASWEGAPMIVPIRNDLGGRGRRHGDTPRRSRCQFAYASAEQEPLDRISLYSFLKRFSSGRSTVRSRFPGS